MRKSQRGDAKQQHLNLVAYLRWLSHAAGIDFSAELGHVSIQALPRPKDSETRTFVQKQFSKQKNDILDQQTVWKNRLYRNLSMA